MMDYRVSRFAVLSSSSHYPAGRPGWVSAFQARPQFSFIRLGFCLAQYPPPRINTLVPNVEYP